jgi:hypothetical protein
VVVVKFILNSRFGIGSETVGVTTYTREIRFGTFVGLDDRCRRVDHALKKVSKSERKEREREEKSRGGTC